MLLPALGIRQTVYVAVAVNALVFAVVIYLVRIARLEPLSTQENVHQATAVTSVATTEASSASANRFQIILPLILVSGALSFAYGVMWVRLLSQLLGGSIYAFATMLASFLFGIALGSAIASRQALSQARALRLFAIVQVTIAVLSAFAFWAIDQIPALVRSLDGQGECCWT